MLNVAMVPFRPKLGLVEENISAMAQQVLDLPKPRAQVIVFPELASSGYLMESLTEASAVTIDDPRWAPLWEASLQTGAEIITGACLRTDRGIFNAAIVVRNGECLYRYSKIYLPTYGMFDEARYFYPGQNLGLYDGFLGKTGILICEDAWHGVLPYSLYAAGASQVIVLSASPSRGFEDESLAPSSRRHWEQILSLNAANYGYSMFYVNRGGSEDGVYFNPSAAYAQPDGSLESHYDQVGPVTFSTPDPSHRFKQQGSPGQNENWALNEKLVSEAHQMRFKESL